MVTVLYDLVIVGAGPAGLTAGIYAARKRMKTAVLSENVGGQTLWSGLVENYLGYQVITGSELASKFREHLKNYGDIIELREGEKVVRVSRSQDEKSFSTVTSNGETFISRTLIIASGRVPKSLGVPGEAEFRNKGVTYCATCDGPLFSGKNVAVIGGGNAALDAAIQLTKIASKVFIINANAQLSGDEILKEKVVNSSNVEVINNAMTTEIFGDKFVSGIKMAVGGSPERDIAVEGVFVEIGSSAVSSIVPDVAKNDRGEIIVDCAVNTSIPGLFAAGDVTSVPEKQIIVAAGEGAKAALAAFRHLVRTRQ